MRVTEHWHRLPRDGRVCLLGDIQRLSGYGPGQPALDGPAQGGSWTICPPEFPANFNHLAVLEERITGTVSYFTLGRRFSQG